MQLSGNVSSTGVSGGISFEGAGSEVTIEPTLLSGTKIADYTIDDVPGELYCLPATDIEVDPDLVSGTKIATITIDGTDYDLYAPAGSTISYTDNTTAGYNTKIGSISINGVSTDINMKSVGYTDLTGGTGVQIGGISVGNSITPVYAPAGGGGGIDYSTSEQDTGLKWIDGRSIYQITFITPSIRIDNSGINIGQYMANLSDVSIPIYAEGVSTDPTSIACSAIWCGFSGTTLLGYCSEGFPNVTYITIQYVKAV